MKTTKEDTWLKLPTFQDTFGLFDASLKPEHSATAAIIRKFRNYRVDDSLSADRQEFYSNYPRTLKRYKLHPRVIQDIRDTCYGIFCASRAAFTGYMGKDCLIHIEPAYAHIYEDHRRALIDFFMFIEDLRIGMAEFGGIYADRQFLYDFQYQMMMINHYLVQILETCPEFPITPAFEQIGFQLLDKEYSMPIWVFNLMEPLVDMAFKVSVNSADYRFHWFRILDSVNKLKNM